MKVQIQKITLKRFKGALHRVVEFQDNTVISGDNATGKTTLFDAFTWLLFGKDSRDRKDFEIKPRSEDNSHTRKGEVSVEAVIAVDGSANTYKRSFREKWVKPRGEEDEVFQGHETLYEINGVPMSAGDFKKNIDSICDESLFKLLTSHTAFAELGWQEKRAVLSKMAGDITLQSVSEGKADFEALLKQLGDRDFVQFRKEINARKKRIKDELETIDPRIAEVHAGMPEQVNEAEIKKELETIDRSIQDEQNALADLGKVYEKQAEQTKSQLDNIAKLEATVRGLKASEGDNKAQLLREANKARVEALNEQHRLNVEIKSLEAKIGTLINAINSRQKIVEELRVDYGKENAKEFTLNPDALTCPTCKQALENAQEKQEELKGNFNNAKAFSLDAIKQEGNRINAEITELEKEFDELKASKNALTSCLEDLIIPEEITELPDVVNPEIEALEQQIIELKAQIKTNEKPEVDRTKLTELGLKRDALAHELFLANLREGRLERIKELEADKKAKGQELASVEKEEFTAERLAKLYSDQVQERVNGMFEVVRFKMFKELINGGEEPDCQALINGVPYEAANNAARINAGIDIINALSKFYDKSVPIWVDNAEASNYILPTESQLIQLRVTKDLELQFN